MTKNLFAMTVLSAGMALAQAPAAAPAAMSAPPTKVAVIQIQAALAATKEGQKAAADLEVRLSPRKKDLDGKQAEIKELQERLQRGSQGCCHGWQYEKFAIASGRVTLQVGE